ncbi:MAG: hypothetical protein WCO23_01580 [bacterium]
MKSKIVATTHLFIIIIAYSSPFWLDWRLFFLGLTLYYIQILIFKGCILTFAQYGTFNESYSTRLFSKIIKSIGIKPNKQRVQFILNYYLPVLLIVICILWQIVLRIPVLTKIN